MPTHVKLVAKLLALPLLAFPLVSAAFAQSPAPIVRGYDSPAPPQSAPMRRQPTVQVSRPAPGIIVRMSPGAGLHTVSTSADLTELRLEHGIANVSVRHPEGHAQILVDLPSGQTALLKDGLYTFNATTNTVRVLRGEAKAFASTSAGGSGIKVKEDHQVAFTATPLRSVELQPFQARADLLPAPESYGRVGEPRYSGPAYGDGFYGGYGYGYGAPYLYDPYFAGGFGYPYFGFGYGYGGGYGFGGYGFRGGYGRRFR